MLLTICDVGTTGDHTWMMFVRSRNGTDWYLYPIVFLKPSATGWDNYSVYKATFFLSDATLRIWYSARNDAVVWHVGYTTATLDTTFMDIFSKVRSDGGDLRFTEMDGVTELSYWMESFDYGGYAVVWVKVPSIPASPDVAKIYVYYGNSAATTTSNIKNTSLWGQGDDFNDNTRDPALWDELKVATGVPYEQNQRLECYVPAVGDFAGFVSVNPNTVNNCELFVFLNLYQAGAAQFYIHTQKITSDNPYLYDNWYRILLLGDGTYYAQRRVTGTVTTLYSGSYISSAEKVKMRILILETGPARTCL